MKCRGLIRKEVMCWAVLIYVSPLVGETAAVRTEQLMPPIVVETLRDTGAAATEIEAGIEPVVNQMNQQLEFYRESNCISNASDPACVQLQKQLHDSYGQMLGILESKLPVLSSSIRGASRELEGRLRGEVGQRVSTADLQKHLSGEDSRIGDVLKRLNSREGQNRTRLSSRFANYLKLVQARGTSANGGQSLTLLASEIYIDMKDAEEMILLIQQEIARSKNIMAVEESLGLVTPEMIAVVDGVKSVLFGEEISVNSEVPVARANESESEPIKKRLEF